MIMVGLVMIMYKANLIDLLKYGLVDLLSMGHWDYLVR